MLNDECPFDLDRTMFFMPVVKGFYRFGQYTPYLKQALANIGYGDVPVILSTSGNNYNSIGKRAEVEAALARWLITVL